MGKPWENHWKTMATPWEHGCLPSGKLTLLWKITTFNGKIHCKWAIFNSYVSLPEGNHGCLWWNYGWLTFPLTFWLILSLATMVYGCVWFTNDILGFNMIQLNIKASFGWWNMGWSATQKLMQPHPLLIVKPGDAYHQVSSKIVMRNPHMKFDWDNLLSMRIHSWFMLAKLVEPTG